MLFADDNVDFGMTRRMVKTRYRVMQYQKYQAQDEARELILLKSTHQWSMSTMPQVKLMECAKPSRLPAFYTHPTFSQ